MVVSSACMMTARMTQAVIAPRLATRGVAPAACTADSATALSTIQEAGDEVGKAAGVAGVDLDDGAHAHAQRGFARGVVDAHPHRDALHDLDPVAAGVLGGKQREARSRRRADALDGAGPLHAGIG